MSWELSVLVWFGELCFQQGKLWVAKACPQPWWEPEGLEPGGYRRRERDFVKFTFKQVEPALNKQVTLCEGLILAFRC